MQLLLKIHIGICTKIVPSVFRTNGSTVSVEVRKFFFNKMKSNVFTAPYHVLLMEKLWRGQSENCIVHEFAVFYVRGFPIH